MTLGKMKVGTSLQVGTLYMEGCQLVAPDVLPYTHTVLLNLPANISKTR